MTDLRRGFEKYYEQGAYHWEGVYHAYPWRYQPQLDATYDVALSLCFAHLPLQNSLRVVDLGCGDGVLLFKLYQRGLVPIGVDLERSGLQLAQKELTYRGMRCLRLVQATVYALPFPEASIDGAVAVEVLEHLEYPSSFLAEVKRVLKPGGVFVLTTPRRNQGASLHSEYHFREYLADELEDLLKSHFVNVEVRGFVHRRIRSLYQLAGAPGKVLVKMMSRYLVNPFTWTTRTHVDADCENLVAVCRS